MLKFILKSMRPKQWTKNILLLAGLYFPKHEGGSPLLFEADSLLRAIIGFFVFCALAGTVYLVNDVIDAPKDRLHPKKRHRPIASGRLSPRAAILAGCILGPLAVVVAYSLSTAFGLCASAYLVLEIIYSLFLKEVFLIDTMIISMGFILRAVSGIIVLRTEDQAVPLTPWFVVCVLFLSLLIAFCKRRAELTAHADRAISQRRVLLHYTEGLLDQGIAVSSTAAVLAYALYAVESVRPWHMLATMPFVIFGIFRYLHLVYAGAGGEDPAEILLRDRSMLGCVAMWAIALLLVFYPAA